jgi:RNA polymerase sigma-70 factor, ECF subfamily
MEIADSSLAPACISDGTGARDGAMESGSASTAPTGLRAEAMSTPPKVAGTLWQPPRSRVDRTAEAEALAAVRSDRLEHALGILLHAYGKPITAFAIRIVHNPDLAYDIRQQVFLEAFQGLHGFEGRSSLWSWLCGITFHRCLDELRRLRKTNVGDETDVLDGLAKQPDMSVDNDRVAKRRALEQCLGKLPAAHRTQVLMRFFLGLSHAEIADAVGDQPGNVQVRISRLLPRLRDCLQGKGFWR